MIQLSAQDACFLALDKPHTPWNGGIVLVYDRPPTPDGMSFQDVLTHFQARLHLVDVLRLKLFRVPGNLDRPYWVEDPNLDLEYHIRNLALPPPGDWRQFCLQVSALVARPLDLSRPPWELHMIEGLDSIERFSKGSFALVLKVHHAALDGRAFLGIMDILHSLDPKAATPSPPDEARAKEAGASSLTLLTRAYFHNVRAPLAAARILGNVLPGLGKLALPAIGRRLAGDVEPAPQTPATPDTRFNRPIGPHRSWGACFFNLADTRPIRKAVEGATVHDIAVAVFGGALRAYLDETGELPDESLKAAIIIDTRSSTDHQGLGNQISAMFANMGSNIEDPLERLTAVRGSTHSAKETTAKLGARDVAGLLELMPEIALAPIAQAIWASGRRSGNGLFSSFNTAVTGMAGPGKPLFLGSARLRHLIGFGPVADGFGLINIQSSYNGEFVLTFTADRDSLPDPQRYENCIYQAFDELLMAARPQGKARNRRKRKAS